MQPNRRSVVLTLAAALALPTRAFSKGAAGDELDAARALLDAVRAGDLPRVRELVAARPALARAKDDAGRSAYVLALGISTPLAGFMADRFGIKRVYLTGLSIFVVGSLLAGLSPNIWLLVGARAVQGVRAEEQDRPGAVAHDAPQRLEPLHARHLEVEGHHVGRRALDPAQRDGTVRRGVDAADGGVAPEDGAHRLTHDDGVVDHQHGEGPVRPPHRAAPSAAGPPPPTPNP